MSTYFKSYQSLGQGHDPQRPTLPQEALLLQAWAQFWRDVMENAVPLPDNALVLAHIRAGLECARKLRQGRDTERLFLETALAEAMQIQTKALLRWCDDRQLVPSQPAPPAAHLVFPAQISSAVHDFQADWG